MSQLPRRANTFCGCCSDAQKYAINSISQAIRLQASKGREEYAEGERIGLPSHAVKSKIPPLLASWSWATTFRSTWQLSLFVIFCVALLQLLPLSCHKSSHPPHPVLAVILLPLATSGSCAGKQAKAGTGSAFKEPQMLPANATCHLDQTERVVQVFQKFHSRFFSLSNTHTNTPSFAYLK